jgi:hypothetical protein
MIILGPAILLGGIFIDAPGQAGRIVLGGLATLISIASIARDRGRPEEPTRVAEYWWLGVALPFATGAWGTFLYLGFRIRRQRPVLWAAASVYFTGFASAIALNVAAHDSGSLSDLAAILLALTWVVSIVHAITIRRTVRRQLNAVPAG